MRYWGLDYLVCVHCKNFPLKIIVLDAKEEDVDTTGLEFPLCKNYCGFLDKNIVSGEKYPCEKCLRIAIREAILYCPKCKRWYPVKNGIVYMLRDNKRREENDKEFLRKWREKIPEEILREGKPYNLADELKQ